MTGPDDQKELRALIRDRLGAIMHNPVRQPYATCVVCVAPLSKPTFQTCWECKRHRTLGWRLADRVVALTYSLEGQQSNIDMHRYKERMSDERRFASDAWQRLSLLVVGFGLWHADCLGRVSKEPVTGVVTVPSLRGRPGPHPLRGLTDYLPRSWRQFELMPTVSIDCAASRRSFDPTHFAVKNPSTVAKRHLVVFEDTWVRGGHAQSAAAALKAAGASEVTVVTIARRLSPGYGPSRRFIETQLLDGREYDVTVCPVTGGACPP
jgi:hypothetical protein